MTRKEENFIKWAIGLSIGFNAVIFLNLFDLVELINIILENHPNINKFVNSNFIIGAFSAFAGATGGAWIIMHNEKKKTKNNDLVLINRGIGIIASLNTTLVNFKTQCSDTQKLEFEKLCDNWNLHEIKTYGKSQKAILRLVINEIFSAKPVPYLPTKELIQTLTDCSRTGPKTFMYCYTARISGTFKISY